MRTFSFDVESHTHRVRKLRLNWRFFSPVENRTNRPESSYDFGREIAVSNFSNNTFGPFDSDRRQNARSSFSSGKKGLLKFSSGKRRGYRGRTHSRSRTNRADSFRTPSIVVHLRLGGERLKRNLKSVSFDDRWSLIDSIRKWLASKDRCISFLFARGEDCNLCLKKRRLPKAGILWLLKKMRNYKLLIINLYSLFNYQHYY